MPSFRYCELWSDVECNGGVREYLIPNRYVQRAGYRKAIDAPEEAVLHLASGWVDPPMAPVANYLLRSEEFEHAAYTSVGSPSVTADAALAPDGTTTADTITDASAVETRARRQTLTVLNDAAPWCVSAHVRKTVSPSFAAVNARLTGGSTVDMYVVLNTATGAVVSTQSAGLFGVQLVQAASVEYWRIHVVARNNRTGNTSLLATFIPAYAQSLSLTGDVAAQASNDFWGGQVNVGITPLPYVRTIGAAASDPLTQRTGPASSALRKGKVIRFCTTDPNVFDEWRVADVTDGNGPEPRVTIVRLEPISADGNRAIVTDFDASGVPVHLYSAVDATAEQVIDDVVLPALEGAGIDYVEKGTVEPTATFDFATTDDDTVPALLDRACDEEHAKAECRWRRNGTTDYRIDVLNEIGSDAEVVHVRTRRNLQRWKRTRVGAQSYNRVRPRGQDDGSHRGIGYAFWRIAARDTGADWIELEDPRGATFPNVIRFDDQFNALYVHLLGFSVVAAQIIDTDATNQRVYVADASLFPVGSYVEFRAGSGASADRLWHLNNAAQQTIDGGVFLRTLDRALRSGAVNYMPDPFTADLFTTPWEIGGTGTISSDTSSDDVFGTGTAFTTEITIVGLRIVRASDSALIGVVAEVFDDGALRLEANALLTLTDEAFAIQRALPLGWDITSDGFPVLGGEVANTVPGATAFSAVFTSAGNATTTFETSIPLINSSLLWRIWCWLDFISLAGTVVVTVSLRRADTGALIGDALTFNTAQHNATQQIAEFVGHDISAATSGVRIRIVLAGTGAHSWNVRFGPLGAMPSAWTRLDRYGPLVAVGENACDLWHDAHDALEAAALPTGYDVELRDLERRGTDAGIVAEELVVGGTLNVYDTDLAVATLQRIHEIDVPDVFRPLETRVRLGTRAETLTELLAQRAEVDVGNAARAIGGALSRAVTDGFLSDGEAALADVPVLDSSGVPTGDVVTVGVSRLATAIAPVIAKSLTRYR